MSKQNTLLSEQDIQPIGLEVLPDKPKPGSLIVFARAIEAEMRLLDDPLIRDLVAALELPCERRNAAQVAIVKDVVARANSRLRGESAKESTERASQP